MYIYFPDTPRNSKADPFVAEICVNANGVFWQNYNILCNRKKNKLEHITKYIRRGSKPFTVNR